MKSIPYSDQELFELLKKNNRIAFNLIYAQYWEISFQLAYKILRDVAIAEDVVQEVFVGLWQSRNGKDVYHLKSYILQSVRFQVFKVVRHNKVIASYIEKDFILNFSNNLGEENLTLADIRRIVDQAISSLPIKCQEIFNLSRNNHMTAKEIAALLDISPKTVDNQINIAIKRIRNSFNTSFLIAELIVLLFYR